MFSFPQISRAKVRPMPWIYVKAIYTRLFVGIFTPAIRAKFYLLKQIKTCPNPRRIRAHQTIRCLLRTPYRGVQVILNASKSQYVRGIFFTFFKNFFQIQKTHQTKPMHFIRAVFFPMQKLRFPTPLFLKRHLSS